MEVGLNNGRAEKWPHALLHAQQAEETARESAGAQQYYKAYLNLRRLPLAPVMKASGLDLPSPLTLKKLDKTDETTIVTLGHRPQALQDRDP